VVPGFDGPELLPSPLIRRAAAPEERGVAQAPRDLLRMRFLVWFGGAVVFFLLVIFVAICGDQFCGGSKWVRGNWAVDLDRWACWIGVDDQM